MPYGKSNDIPVTAPNNVGANSTVADVVGNKDDLTLAGRGMDSLAGMANASWLHVHNPSLVYPRDADPVTVTSGLGAWTGGAKVELISTGEKTEAFDIHFVILGNISATDDYVIKLYSGEIGAEVFWGECAFTRDTNQVRGSQVPIQGPPVPAGTRISAAMLSGAGGNDVDIKIYTHEYPA